MLKGKRITSWFSTCLVMCMMLTIVAPLSAFAVSAPAATVGNVNIIGTVGSLITPKDVVITITNNQIVPAGIENGTNLASWITNLPAGLEAKAKGAVADGATTVTIEITGTPSAAVSAPMTIVIPADQLVSNGPLTVTENTDAKFTVVSSGYIFDISEGNITIMQGDAPETDIKVTHGAGQVTTGNLDKNQEIIIVGTTIANTIIADDVEAKVTLNGVSINANTLAKSPFLLQGASTVELTLLGTNSLVAATDPANSGSASANFAGIQVKSGNTLTITSASTGSLTASGGAYAAGIGGGQNGSNGTVVIDGGTITALAGRNGAGIGGGNGSLGAGGTIIINGGTILAKANVEGPGIGDGYQYTHGGTGGSTITINGGIVTAIGGSCAGSGIGGACGGAAQNITILEAATVKAAASSSARAIWGVGNQITDPASTASVLMVNFSGSKASGTEIQIINKATNTVVASFAPDKNGNFSSTAVSVGNNTTYYLRTAGVIQQHSNPASADFTMETESRLKQFNLVTNLTFSVISPTTANFDKKVDQQADITTTMTLNGNTLSAIKNGDTTLVENVDYTVTESVVTIKKEYLASQAVGTTNLTFEFSAGANQTLDITISNTTPPSGGGGGGSLPPLNNNQAIVIVNGIEENAGRITESIESGKPTVTIEVNNTVIESKIEEAIKKNPKGEGNKVQVPVIGTNAQQAKVVLTGDIVKKLENNNFDISIKRDTVDYIIPAKELTISSIAEKLGVKEESLQDIKVEARITKLDEAVVERYNEIAKRNNAEIVFPPVEFKIVAKTTKTDGTTQEQSISRFSNYVERVLEIPAGMDPSKITTGIVFNADGTYSHVPTEVFESNGKWFARLNSLTNSNYSIIWNPLTVESVKGHWSEKAVNDMASRLVVFNIEEFKPDKAITRGDFAEYIVRALGLYREGSMHENKFKDVSADGDRALAILIANEYGIVAGYPDGTFRQDTLITREEAMILYQRAMKLTKLVGTDPMRYETYTDYKQVSSWATSYVKEVLSAHVFNGNTATTFLPKSSLTYAEAAQAIKNLLVESKLINK